MFHDSLTICNYESWKGGWDAAYSNRFFFNKFISIIGFDQANVQESTKNVDNTQNIINNKMMNNQCENKKK